MLKLDQNPRLRSATLSLLNWYDRNKRDFPWRSHFGDKPDVYNIWLSEIMLQQTRTVTVCSYYEDFLNQWPTIQELATATQHDVLKAWAGLGYYTRARNLHACAKIVAQKYGGIFPKTEEELMALPGIGLYTANAIMAIGYNQPSTVVDGNVRRVISRLYRIDVPLPANSPKIRALAASLTSLRRPGDYAQAIMDLGATICKPRKPNCQKCPWKNICKAWSDGNPENYPKRKLKGKNRRRYGIIYWIERSDGAIVLRKRPEKGMLAGMIEIPNTEWQDRKLSERSVRTQSPLPISWEPIVGQITHSFSHFDLELEIISAKSEIKPEGTFWCSRKNLRSEAFPRLMVKVVEHVEKIRKL